MDFLLTPLALWRRFRPGLPTLSASILLVSCAAQPVVTQTVYTDRSTWITLEVNPAADDTPTEPHTGQEAGPKSSVLASLLKGFVAEKDYNLGVIGMIRGQTGYAQAFVEPEIMMLSSQLAKGFAMASPKERVAYCLTVDHSAMERFITTGWAYVKPPYLYFKLTEYRTPVRVSSPAAPTSEACLTKPTPGYKTSDRFFKLDYEPKDFVLTHGALFGGTIFNGRGEVMFKIASLSASLPATEREGNHAAPARSPLSRGGSKTGAVSSPEPDSTGKALSSKGREIIDEVYRSLPPQTRSPAGDWLKAPATKNPPATMPTVGPDLRNP